MRCHNLCFDGEASKIVPKLPLVLLPNGALKRILSKPLTLDYYPMSFASTQAKGSKSALFLSYPWLTAYSHIKFTPAQSIDGSESFPLVHVMLCRIRRSIAKQSCPTTLLNCSKIQINWLHFECQLFFQ